MMATDTTTAVTMTHSSSTMPMAVMTESSEKTMSSNMICAITLANDDGSPAGRVLLLPFKGPVNLEGALREEKQATANQNQIATREGAAEREDRVGEPREPGERKQQPHAHQHRAEQPHSARRAPAESGGASPTGWR